MPVATDSARGWRRRVRALLLYGIVPALLFVAVFSGMRFKHYVERDPAFCGMCHLQSRAELLWTNARHEWLVCQDCHHQTERDAFRMLVDYSLDRRPPDSNGVGGSGLSNHQPAGPINACESCHVKHDKGWAKVASSTGHKKHLEAKKPVGCLDCHAEGIHRFRAALDTCEKCHGERTLRTEGMEKLHCLACHDFVSPGETIKPDAKVCVTCHRSEGVSDEASYPPNAPMAKLQCWECHRPHVEDGKAIVACAECHEVLHGSHNDRGHEKCAGCHPAHSWVSDRNACAGCHQDLPGHHVGQECGECHKFVGERKDGAP